MSPRGPSIGVHAATMPGYTTIETASTRALVLDVADAWLDDLIASGSTIYDWAESLSAREEAEGRGTVLSFPAPLGGPDARARWAVRHYRRGGLIASSLGDRYLRVGRLRPFRELAASVTARERGVRTPAVICGAVYPAGAHYRADIVTEMVPDVATLADILRDADTDDVTKALQRSSRLIARLSQAGVHHVDLNARNVLLPLVQEDEAWVIDLDRARILAAPSGASRARMCARLTRSVVKIAVEHGDPVDATAVETALLSGG